MSYNAVAWRSGEAFPSVREMMRLLDDQEIRCPEL